MIAGVPYDAEVEYLKSTGTQYIDTGIYLDGGSKVEITAKAVSTDTCNIFGSYQSNEAFALFQQRYDNVLAAQYYGERIASTTTGYSAWHNLILNKGAFYIDDVLIGTLTQKSFSGHYRATLFAINREEGLLGPSPAYIKRCKIWDANTTIVRDLISVRVGQVGYLYDRVTRSFPPHYGTFIAGPDVTTPVMGLRKYPQIGGAA